MALFTVPLPTRFRDLRLVGPKRREIAVKEGLSGQRATP
jgi:hypothetical protein